MNTVRRVQSRPWTLSAIVAAALAVILLVIPISYQKTVGHDVALTINSPNLDAGQLQTIASQLKNALQAGNVSITQGNGGAPVLTARVSGRSRLPVERVAAAFAAGLSSKGIPAQARVSPRIERVLGSLYAYARDNIIDIHVTSKGKTPEQIQNEIVSQLEAAGVQDPKVEYKREGNKATLTVQMDKGSSGTPPVAANCPQLNLTVDDQPPGGGDGQHKRVEVKVNRTPGMTDAQVKDEVQRQLKAQGVDADVSVENGKIQINPRGK